MNAKFGKSIWGERENHVMRRFWNRAKTITWNQPREDDDQRVYITDPEEATESRRFSFILPVILFFLGLLAVR